MVEPAAPVEEVKAEAGAMAEDAPDVAAQRSREKSSEEGQFLVDDAHHLSCFVCCDICQFTVVLIACA